MTILTPETTAALAGRVKAAVFDLDGTLIDSMPSWRRLTRDYLAGRGVDETTAAEFQESVWGRNIYQVCDLIRDRFTPSETPAEIMAGIHDLLMYKYATVCPVKPNVKMILDTFENAGVHMCVATATHRVPAEFALRHNALYEYFERLFTVPEVGKTKAEPDIYNAARDFMGADTADTAVFEDCYPCMVTAGKAGYVLVGADDSVENDARKRDLCEYFIM